MHSYIGINTHHRTGRPVYEAAADEAVDGAAADTDGPLTITGAVMAEYCFNAIGCVIV